MPTGRIGHLPARQSLPWHEQAAAGAATLFRTVREVRVKLDTGKVLCILSNDLDASAQEIADLYKRRWATELFFRWVKQTFKRRHFLGISENAVRIQIAVALMLGANGYFTKYQRNAASEMVCLLSRIGRAVSEKYLAVI